MSDWGEGALNNNIGWGKGFDNTISWGSVYSVSSNGQTNITGVGLAFTFTINTTRTSTGSSASNQFKLPLVSSFNGITSNVDWGDGTSNVITAFNQAEITHTYGSSGTYEIKITGALRSFRFTGAGDRLKIINILHYGVLEIDTDRAFQGCNNLTQSAIDAPLISSTNLNSCFENCFVFNGAIGNWDLSSVTTMYAFLDRGALFNQDVSGWNIGNVNSLFIAFRGCLLFNSNIGLWNTTSLLNTSFALEACNNFNQSLANWDINQITNFTGLFNNATGINTANYDATLISWNNKVPLTGKSISFGNSKFTLGGAAAAARASLISTYGWTITDGGGI